MSRRPVKRSALAQEIDLSTPSSKIARIVNDESSAARGQVAAAAADSATPSSETVHFANDVSSTARGQVAAADSATPSNETVHFANDESFAPRGQVAVAASTTRSSCANEGAQKHEASTTERNASSSSSVAASPLETILPDPTSPLWLTYKYRVDRLSKSNNVYDFQLRTHFLHNGNLYALRCQCPNHKHNKQRCTISDDRECPKCGTPTALLVTYQSLLYHGTSLLTNNAYACCTHVHRPRCERCSNCRSFVVGVGEQDVQIRRRMPCSVPEDFECNLVTDRVCPNHPGQFTWPIGDARTMIREHVYNTRFPIFYFCQTHRHVHDHPRYPDAVCTIQSYRCCEDAVRVDDYDFSFVVTVTRPRSGDDLSPNAWPANATGLNPEFAAGGGRQPRATEYIVYDPRIWREQSFNHFVSFVRAVISLPEAAKERYGRFEDSNFSISNIKRYKSGKESIVRTTVTGFETRGLYQTATISCLLPRDELLLPRNLYRLMDREGYDMSLVCVKRDPSIKSTCMFVCRARENPNPESRTIIIPDAISKPMNQDQDGDKNAVYALRKRTDDGFDSTRSFRYVQARYELGAAFRKPLTLIATPRYLLSETNIVLIERERETLGRFAFDRRTRGRGPRFTIEAGSGYLRDEFEPFERELLRLNRANVHRRVTVYDLLMDTPNLRTVVESGAKGTREHLDVLIKKLRDRESTLRDAEPDMIALMSKYLTSSQELSRDGRNQFAALYAGVDLVLLNGKLYLNKVYVADYTTFSSIGSLLWNEASLELFTEDLMGNLDGDDAD